MIQPIMNCTLSSATVTQWKLFAPGSYPAVCIRASTGIAIVLFPAAVARCDGNPVLYQDRSKAGEEQPRPRCRAVRQQQGKCASNRNPDDQCQGEPRVRYEQPEGFLPD